MARIPLPPGDTDPNARKPKTGLRRRGGSSDVRGISGLSSLSRQAPMGRVGIVSPFTNARRSDRFRTNVENLGALNRAMVGADLDIERTKDIAERRGMEADRIKREEEQQKLLEKERKFRRGFDVAKTRMGVKEGRAERTRREDEFRVSEANRNQRLLTELGSRKELTEAGMAQKEEQFQKDLGFRKNALVANLANQMMAVDKSLSRAEAENRVKLQLGGLTAAEGIRKGVRGYEDKAATRTSELEKEFRKQENVKLGEALNKEQKETLKSIYENDPELTQFRGRISNPRDLERTTPADLAPADLAPAAATPSVTGGNVFRDTPPNSPDTGGTPLRKSEVTTRPRSEGDKEIIRGFRGTLSRQENRDLRKRALDEGYDPDQILLMLATKDKKDWPAWAKGE